MRASTIRKGLVKVNPIQDSIPECPIEGTLILSGRQGEVGWPVFFLAAFNFHTWALAYALA